MSSQAPCPAASCGAPCYTSFVPTINFRSGCCCAPALTPSALKPITRAKAKIKFRNEIIFLLLNFNTPQSSTKCYFFFKKRLKDHSPLRFKLSPSEKFLVANPVTPFTLYLIRSGCGFCGTRFFWRHRFQLPILFLQIFDCFSHIEPRSKSDDHTNNNPDNDGNVHQPVEWEICREAFEIVFQLNGLTVFQPKDNKQQNNN